jgi:hypothetical protein
MKGYRIPIVAGALLLLIVLGVIAYSHSKNTSGAAAFPGPFLAQTQPDQVQASNLQLKKSTECSVSCYELTGEIKNNSAYPFNMVVGTVDAYDCPTGTITADCTHIGQNTFTVLEVQEGGSLTPNTVLMEFPPNQVREAFGEVELDGMPPVQGHFLWSFTITQLQEWPQ